MRYKAQSNTVCNYDDASIVLAFYSPCFTSLYSYTKFVVYCLFLVISYLLCIIYNVVIYGMHYLELHCFYHVNRDCSWIACLTLVKSNNSGARAYQGYSTLNNQPLSNTRCTEHQVLCVVMVVQSSCPCHRRNPWEVLPQLIQTNR